MKKLLFLFCTFTLLAFTSFHLQTVTPVMSIKSLPVKIKPITFDTVKIDLKGNSDFLDAIGYQESRNRYHVVNRYGYMGKYQFGKSTLKTLKIKVSQSEFLKDTILQEQAMLALLKYNKKRLKKLIDRYDGQIIHGILVTESGLLAAAHLGGQGSVKKWFRTGKVRKDGNGVGITKYMEKFGGYYLSL